MKVFISYHHLDKALAATIKMYLEREYGLNVFLAHEDIEPTLHWQDVIIEELKQCDVFIYILTNNYKTSLFTDQEAGFALAKEVFIIPLAAGQTPYGFLSRIQALSLNSSNMISTYRKIAELIYRKPNLKDALLESVIKVFGKSDSYDRTKKVIDTLMEFEGLYSAQQKDEIIRHAIRNSQINECFTAVRRLKAFIAKYKSELDADLITQFINRTAKS
jgi:hypothetical protein